LSRTGLDRRRFREQMMCAHRPAARPPSRPRRRSIRMRPMTSSTNTLVEVRAIDRTSSPPRGSKPDVLRREPNPGQQSVIASRCRPFWDADAGDRISQLSAISDTLWRCPWSRCRRCRRNSDVVSLENLDQALVLRAILVDPGELVACRPECATRVWRSARTAAALSFPVSISPR